MKEQVQRSIAAKMSATHRIRPDPYSMVLAFSAQANETGHDLAKEMQAYIADFNISQLEGMKISKAESKAMELLIKLPEEGVQAIKYHYQNYKVNLSALPVKMLACIFSVHKRIKPINSSSDLWKDIYFLLRPRSSWRF